MVQNQQTRIATDLAITSGTILTPDQYRLTGVTTVPMMVSGVLLNVPMGLRDLGVGDNQLFLRVRVTENFDQLATTVTITPVVSPTTNLADADAIEHYSKALAGALLRVGATWHFPLRPISTSEALTAALAPIWPTQLQYIGAKFVVTGTAFGAGKVTCDITPHMSPDGDATILGAKLPPKMSAAGW